MISANASGEVSPTATPPRRRGVGLAVVGLLVVGGVLGAVAWVVGPGAGTATATFQVMDHTSDEVVFERELPIGSDLELEHVHSVTKRPVQERFSVGDDTTLLLEELIFDDFGPNLPAGPEAVGDHASWSKVDGVYHVDHHGQEIGSVPLMVGSASVDHRLHFHDGEQLRLLDVARSGSRVELRVGDHG